MKKNKDVYIAILIAYILIILAVILYFTWIKRYVKIPYCPIYKWTGIYCPACGGTRAVISLVSGDVLHSVLYNPMIIYIFVFSTFYLIIESINTKLEKKIIIPWKLIIRIGLWILLFNCIIQNIIRVL